MCRGLCEKKGKKKTKFSRAKVQTLGISPSFGGSQRDPLEEEID
jgi:hypothetical protein